MTYSDFLTLFPLLFLAIWAVLLLLVDLWIPAERKGITALLSAVGLAITLGLTLGRGNGVHTALNGTVVVDGFAVFLDMIFLGSGLLGIALAYNYLKRNGIERGEYYILLMFSIVGLYILSGFVPGQAQSEEAALKYFLMGTFSSGFVLYGIALIFGATAHTDFRGILDAVAGGTVISPLLLVGAVLLLAGFAFKSAIVPFHMWTPDVYHGAPSPVTGFMSVGAKAAGFAALMRVFVVAFPNLSTDLTPVLWALSAITMVIGNVVAIVQTNIKRMLAYSSIAHSGYLLMAFVPYGNGEVLSNSISAMLFYLVAYSLTTMGAWAVIVAVERSEGRGLTLNEYAGVGRKHPWLGASMTIFMLSFIGVPITLGFWGKFYLFRTVLEGGYAGLALIGLLTSLVSAFYYLRVVVVMYMRPGEPEASRDAWVNLAAIGSAAAVILLSLLPGPLFDMASRALLSLQ